MYYRNHEIDCLRGVVILFIVVSHLWRIYFPWVLSTAPVFGTLLIDLMSIISGFLISCITVKKIDQLKADKTNLALFIKAYFVRRICRIYPVATTVLLLVLLCSFVMTNSKYFSMPGNILEAGVYIMTYTFNYYFTSVDLGEALAPCWSLSFEEQFYIIFPLFLLLTKNNHQRIIVLTGLLFFVTFIARPLTFYYYPIKGIFFSQARCDSLIYGCLLYHATKQPWFEVLKISQKGNGILRTTVMMLLLIITTSITTLSFSMNAAFTIGNMVPLAIAIPVILNCNVLVFPTLIYKGLLALGVRVYSGYLIHFPIILLTKEIWDRSNYSSFVSLPVYSFLVLLLVGVATELLYRLVEKPGIEKGKIISDRILQGNLPANINILSNQDVSLSKDKDFA